MNKKKIIKISLSISLLGILFLIFIMNLEPRIAKINELGDEDLEKRVKIQGKIVDSKKINDNFYIKLINDSTGEIEILLGKNFGSNKELKIMGELQKYENKFQINTEKIEEIKK